MENKKKNDDDGELGFAYEDYEQYVDDSLYMSHGWEEDLEKYIGEPDKTEIFYGGDDDDDYPDGSDEYGQDRVLNKMTLGDDQSERLVTIPPDTMRRGEPVPTEPAVPKERTFAERPYEPPVGDHKTKLDVPKGVLEVIDLLKAHTYTSYLVGDCVNMLVLGERVMDFDIACNAAIERIIAICEDRFKVREDLLERGELIIINGGMGISVAPYRSRIDGSGKPIYCKTIDEDLRRRTFTSETVAYNPDSGIYDKFGGLACITAEKTILRAIDEDRFREMEFEQARLKKKPNDEPKKIVIDAIRENPECILTAMQKYARGEAEISDYTLRNINDNAELVDMMLPSETARYFRRVITGRRAGEAMNAFRGVVCRIFPALEAEVGFEQKSIYQDLTLFEHTAKAVGYGFPDYAVRLALLLHGIGKPDCAADRGEYMTFYGHSERGVMLARDMFEGYEADSATVDAVLFLIAHHDDHISPDNITDFVEAFGTEPVRLLLLFQSANIRAKSSDPVNERVSASLRQLADNIKTYAPRPSPGLGRRR
ncbi:MAG: hypothetical protein K5876_07990 [Ruminiclostridium sp.]|nr:hypothetical protein [Ruminiclostridium sp.]